MRKILLLFIGLVFLSQVTQAQELNFNVRIVTQRLQTVDPKVFETLEQSIKDFMNNTQWTNEDFAPEERIDCNLILTIQVKFFYLMEELENILIILLQ